MIWKKILCSFSLWRLLLRLTGAEILSWFDLWLVRWRTRSITGLKETMRQKFPEDSKGRFTLSKLACAVSQSFRRRYQELRSVCRYNRWLVEVSRKFVDDYLMAGRSAEIALYGTGVISSIILALARYEKMRIAGVYDTVGGFSLAGQRVSHFGNLKGFKGKILVSGLFGAEFAVQRLQGLGIEKHNMLLLKQNGTNFYNHSNPQQSSSSLQIV